LQAYLAEHDAVIVADLYAFRLADGTLLRYSGWTTPLTIPGTAFPSGSLNYEAADYTVFAKGPRFGRSKVTTRIGVEPAELDIAVLAGAGDAVGDFAFADAVRLGLFDGAVVELDRFFAPPAADGMSLAASLGAIVWFYGVVAEADAGRSRVDLKVKSLMSLLAVQQMPRRLYHAACTHAFGDAMCGFDRTGMAVTARGARRLDPGAPPCLGQSGAGDPLRPGHRHRRRRRQRGATAPLHSSPTARCTC
jgi:hypothetical protein